MRDTILAVRVYVGVVVVSTLAIVMLAAQLLLALIGAGNAALWINKALDRIINAEMAYNEKLKRRAR